MEFTLIIPGKGSEDGYDWDRMWWVRTEEEGSKLMTVREIIDNVAQAAYIAGYQGSKGIGLNLTVEERADQYCQEKGLRT